MSDTHELDQRCETQTQQLWRIVTRAGELGFCTFRVATALGISPQAVSQPDIFDAHNDPYPRRTTARRTPF